MIALHTHDEVFDGMGAAAQGQRLLPIGPEARKGNLIAAEAISATLPTVRQVVLCDSRPKLRRPTGRGHLFETCAIPSADLRISARGDRTWQIRGGETLAWGPRHFVGGHRGGNARTERGA